MKKKKKKKKNGSRSNNSDKENHRTMPLSTVVSNCVKQWFQEAKAGYFSGEFVREIVDAINVRYGDVSRVDSINSIDNAAQESC
ncbi:unnamed protein product [Camellia sinensis]